MVSTPTKSDRQKSKSLSGRFSSLRGGGTGPVELARLTEWCDHLKTRKHPHVAVDACNRPDDDPVCWELPAGTAYDQRLVRQLHMLRTETQSKKRQRVGAGLQVSAHDWIREAGRRRADVGYAIEALAWAYVLPDLAAYLSVATWWELHDHLLSTSRESARVWTGASLLPVQMLAGELGLVLAYHFPELDHAASSAKKSLKFLSESMTELLDGQGVLHAKHIHLFRPLFACWTRCLAIRAAMATPKLPKEARGQHEWMVRQTLRMTRYDLGGSFQQFDAPRNRAAFLNLLTLAVQLSGGPSERAVLQQLLRDTGTSSRKPVKSDLPKAVSYQSDWAELAVMRSEWSTNGLQLTVAHAEKQLRVELVVAGRPLLSGVWQPEFHVNGTLLALDEDWSTTCWYSDDDVDYLELQTRLASGAKWQRQIMLAKQDQFLFTMDAVLGTSPTPLVYSSRVPIVSGVSFQPAPETHEGYLRINKRRALVIPLSLPEWRQSAREGQIVATNSGVEIQQTSQGNNACFAQFIDLHPRRLREECTWRQLTVVENLRIVNRDEAVGYRVQVGHEQWVFFRELAPAISRTILGQHVSSEFFAARFLNDGDVELLVEVEEE